MTEPIRVLHVTSRLRRRGAETRTIELCRRADPGRFRFHFLLLSGEADDLDADVLALGGKLHYLRLDPWHFAPRFRRLLAAERIDVVHSHVHFASGYMLRIAAKAGVPVRAAHFRCSDDNRRPTLPRRVYRTWMCRWLDRYATDLLAVSRSAMEAAWGPRWTADPRCRVIYNGLEPAAFRRPAEPGGVGREFGLEGRGPLLIHVGAIHPQKNHPRLLEVFAEFLSSHPRAALLLVGPGIEPTEAQVRRRAAELGLEGKAIFCGSRADVPRLLSAADAMVFPSLSEGLPGAVLEASAAGTPVVASDLPPMREIAAHLPAVRCVPLETENRLWVKAIAAAVASPEAAREAAREAFARSIFTIDRCSAATEAVWGRAASATRARGAA